MPFLPFGILNQGTAGVVRGCQICCMTLVGYLSGFCGRTFDALSGRKNIPIITVPQNLLAVTTVGPSLPVQGRCDFWDHFFFFLPLSSWDHVFRNRVWYVLNVCVLLIKLICARNRFHSSVSVFQMRFSCAACSNFFSFLINSFVRIPTNIHLTEKVMFFFFLISICKYTNCSLVKKLL